MIVPFAAGGPADTVARILNPAVSDLLGQQIIVENVGGSGGMVGSARVAKASPDGYLLVLGNVGTHAANQTFYKNPLYNAATDFTPVILVAQTPLVLLARKDFPAENLQAFIAYARKNQASMQFGSGGPGSPSLPDLASAHEQGLREFDASNWFGVFLPKGAPPAIVQRLHAAIATTMDNPAVQTRMQAIGADVPGSERRSPDYLQKFVEAEIKKWAGPIKASGISAD